MTKCFNRAVLLTLSILTVTMLAVATVAQAQERIKIAYSSADASNTVWFTALDSGLYRKHGLDVELVFIQSSTTSVSRKNCAEPFSKGYAPARNSRLPENR